MDEFIMINDTDNLEDLEQNKSDWDSQTHYWRKVSNDKSIELYGKNNIDRYNEMKAKLIANADPDYKNKDYVSDLSDLHENVKAIYDNTDTSLFDNWEEKVGKAESAERDNGYSMAYVKFILPSIVDELEVLNKKWNDFLYQPSSFRSLADGMAISIFGVNNHVLYYRIKAKLLEDADNKLLSADTDEEGEDALYRDTVRVELESSYDIIRRYDRASDIESLRDSAKTVGDYLKYDKLLEGLCSPLKFDSIVPQYSPLLTVDEMQKYGVFSDNNYYAESNMDNYELFVNLEKGIYPDAYEYKTLVTELFNKLSLSNFKDNSIKQQLLECGWNPDVIPDEKSFHIAKNKNINFVNEKYNSLDIVDISRYDSCESHVLESDVNVDELYPVFIVCTYTYSDFGKIVVKVTDSKYSHSAMGFDPGLTELYSFNMNTPKKKGGLSFESINGYIHDSENAELFVGCVFLKKDKYLKLRSNVNWYIANYDKCNYSIGNLFRILINKKTVKKYQRNMVCSQFVDNLFKLVNVDLSGKTSNLTTPKDLSKTQNEKVFIVYEGLAKKYDKDKTLRLINSVQKKYQRGLLGNKIVENTIFSPLNESMQFYRLYHGSINKYDVLKCNGIDFGNRFQNIGFSLFLWTKKEAAIGWAIFSLLRKIELDNVLPIHVKGCKDSQFAFLTEESYDIIKTSINNIPKEYKEYYIYTVKPDKDHEYGLGHSSNTPNCVTMRGDDVKYETVEKYILTMQDVVKYTISIKEDYEPSKREYGLNHRLTPPLMTKDFMYNHKLRKVIKNSIYNGELVPGDDIEEYLKSKGVSIKEPSLLERIKDTVNNESCIDLQGSLMSKTLEDLEDYSLYYKNLKIAPVCQRVKKWDEKDCTWWYCCQSKTPSDIDEEQYFKSLKAAINQYAKDEYFIGEPYLNMFVFTCNGDKKYCDDSLKLIPVGQIMVCRTTDGKKDYEWVSKNRLEVNSDDIICAVEESTLLEKSIPINFNNDGDLIINTPSDFEKEYQKSHALLIEYDKLENLEPMKFELSKLWYMNNVIEQKIHKPACKEKQTLVKLRARILNDFKKYIKVVLKEQPEYNFTEYYNSTEFADNNIKITKSTINRSLELLKNILGK